MPMVPGVEYIDSHGRGARGGARRPRRGALRRADQGRGRRRSTCPRATCGGARADRAHGALLIVDEIQTGAGRTGRVVRLPARRHHPRRDHRREGHRRRVPDRRAHHLRCGERAVLPGHARLDVRRQRRSAPPSSAAVLAEIERRRPRRATPPSRGRADRARRSPASTRRSSTGCRGQGLLIGVGAAAPGREGVVAAAQEHGLIINAAERRTIRLAPALTIGDVEIDEFIRAVRRVALRTVEDALARHHRRRSPHDPPPAARRRPDPRRAGRDPRSRGRAEEGPLEARRRSTGPQTVAVIFDKSSTRTRVSFAVGIADLGGSPLIISTANSQLGGKETPSDTARVLERQVAAIVWRTYAQAGLEEMAAGTTRARRQRAQRRLPPVPAAGRPAHDPRAQGRPRGLTLTFFGDGKSNMAHSYVLACVTAGHARARRVAGVVRAPRRRRRRRRPPRRRDRRLGHAVHRSRSRPPPAPTSSSPTPGCRWARRRRSSRACATSAATR